MFIKVTIQDLFSKKYLHSRIIHPLSQLAFGIYAFIWIFLAVPGANAEKRALLVIGAFMIVAIVAATTYVNWRNMKYLHLYTVLNGMGIVFVWASVKETDFIVALTCVLGLTGLVMLTTPIKKTP